MQVVVVIPTLNEEDTIGELVHHLAKHFSVIVVDDNSSDLTRSIAKSFGAHVIHNLTPLGLGKSLLAGFKLALEFKPDKIVTIDAGGSHNWEQVFPMLELSKQYDLVIGSRFLPFSKYINTNGVWYRPLLSKIAGGVLSMAQARSNQKDWTSGYRVYDVQLVRYLLKFSYFSNRHPIQIELLGRTNESGATVKEYPITYIAGRSSFNKKAINEAINVFLHILNHYSGRPKEYETDNVLFHR